MESYSAALLILVFLVIGITLTILLLALLRETLFWYWRSKGVMQEPQDILSQSHETAILIRDSIAGLKAVDPSVPQSAPSPQPAHD